MHYAILYERNVVKGIWCLYVWVSNIEGYKWQFTLCLWSCASSFTIIMYYYYCRCRIEKRRRYGTRPRVKSVDIFPLNFRRCCKREWKKANKPLIRRSLLNAFENSVNEMDSEYNFTDGKILDFRSKRIRIISFRIRKLYICLNNKYGIWI